MKLPSVSFDQEADVLYVHLADGDVYETVSVGDLRMIDRSKDGTIIGVEFVSASQGIDLSDIPFAPTIAAAIGDSGYPVKVYA